MCGVSLRSLPSEEFLGHSVLTLPVQHVAQDHHQLHHYDNQEEGGGYTGWGVRGHSGALMSSCLLRVEQCLLRGYIHGGREAGLASYLGPLLQACQALAVLLDDVLDLIERLHLL